MQPDDELSELIACPEPGIADVLEIFEAAEATYFAAASATATDAPPTLTTNTTVVL
jgi:hypothetical protein